MADKQLSGPLGLTDAQESTNATDYADLAVVTADGANQVTVSDVSQLRAGMVVDIVDPTDGTERVADRTITEVHSDGTVVYDGADGTAQADDVIILANSYGNDSQSGYFNPNHASVAQMRARLAAIDSGYYTESRLNNMTFNDLVYAIRVNDDAETIKA